MFWPLVVLNVILVVGCQEYAPESRPHVPVDTWLTIQTTPSYPVPDRQVDDVYKIQISNGGIATQTKNGIDAGRVELSEANISALRGLVSLARLERNPAVPMHVQLVDVDVFRNGESMGVVVSQLMDDTALATRIFRQAQSHFGETAR
jgi:hypothetical protein